MIRTVVRKLTVVTAGIGLMTCVAGAKSAHAERIISDFEASKLTLESLTAVPVYHPVAHHVAARHAGSLHMAVASRRGSNMHGLVHLASYRTVKRSTAVAHVRHRT
ncbi:hypothetical protein [Acetobacter estunensis]|uniref:hypothetical protein n=1 Tax=Acetobacter estunensis TaxID=104097 RepID=UPI001C2CE6F9|nr:hypothetical protein [Acetobacter estunensis]MBV1836577.1 hypothetical protein [Acetobacter estunensis]